MGRGEARSVETVWWLRETVDRGHEGEMMVVGTW